MQTWCRKFYGGVAIESGTCQAGALEHDHCLTPREGNELSCGTIAHCPSASNSSGGQCDRCATVLAEDWNQEIRLSGDLRWAPFGATEAEELQLAGYDISVVDECGVELLKLGRVPMQMGKSYDVQECCSSNWYSWIIQNELVPREMVAISISTWQDNLATTIPIYTSFITSTTFLTVTSTTATATSITSSSVTSTTMSLTTTASLTGTTATVTLTTVTATTVTATSTSTSSQTQTLSTTTRTTVTTTTVTATVEAPAQLEGCIGLSVSDADLFAESSDAKEAFRKTLAQAAGDGVEPEYVQDLTVSVGQSCDARRLAQHGVLVFSSDTEGRRLQEAVKVDYVIVFPAALGTEVAIQVAESSRQILETITVEEVTTILQEEVQNIPVLQNVSVSVTTKNVQEVQITVTSSASDTTATTDVSTFAMVSGLLAILFPVSMFAIWWRCQKRLRPDSDAPGEHAVKPEPCEEDEDEQRSDGGEPAPSDFTAVEPSATPPKSKKKLKPKVKVRRGRRRSLDEDGQAVKHKKRLKPKKTLELESINVIDAEASPQLVPPQLALAPARSFLEDEGVLFDDRPPMPPIISRGSLFSQAELPEDNRAELEDIGVLFDRPPEQVQVVESPPACSFWSESSDADATISRP